MKKKSGNVLHQEHIVQKGVITILNLFFGFILALYFTFY